MQGVRFKAYVMRLYLAVLGLFVINKLGFRAWVLKRDLPRAADIVVLSMPNTIEAVIGLTNATVLLLLARHYFSPRFDRVSRGVVHVAALVLAGAYVLTQEFKLHNLGGRNVYDPYDVVASVLGLVLTFAVLWRFGVLERVPGAESPADAQA